MSTFLCGSGIGVADYSVSISVEVPGPILSQHIIPFRGSLNRSTGRFSRLYITLSRLGIPFHVENDSHNMSRIFC